LDISHLPVPDVCHLCRLAIENHSALISLIVVT
jgi:hypothetical protein